MAHGVLLDEGPPGVDIVTHQGGEGLFCDEPVVEVDLEQGPHLGIHGRCPELTGVHLTEALEPLDIQFLPLVLRLDVIQFGVVLHPDRLGPDLHRVQRRLGDVDETGLDELWHVAEEECQQQGADVRAVDVGVGEDDRPSQASS